MKTFFFSFSFLFSLVMIKTSCFIYTRVKRITKIKKNLNTLRRFGILHRLLLFFVISGFLRLFRSSRRVFLMFSKPLPYQTNLILTQRFSTKSPTDSTGFRHQHLAPSVGNGTKSRLVISINFYLAEAKANIAVHKWMNLLKRGSRSRLNGMPLVKFTKQIHS